MGVLRKKRLLGEDLLLGGVVGGEGLLVVGLEEAVEVFIDVLGLRGGGE